MALWQSFFRRRFGIPSHKPNLVDAVITLILLVKLFDDNSTIFDATQ